MEVPRTDGDVVSSGVMLTLIICNVLFSRKVLDAIFPLFDWICNPKESHFHGVSALTLDRVLAMPTAVELSQLTGIGGCGWLSSSSVTQKIAARLQFKRRAPSSASAAEATTKRKMAHNVKNA